MRGKYGRAFAIVKGNEAVASSMGISPYRYKVLAFTIASLIGGVSGFLYMVVVQYTSPETMSFGHSITLLASMVIGGAGSILGSLLGGAYYVLVPQLTNAIDSSLTAVLQGAILLVILFVLPGGLVSLPRLWRRRKNEHRGMPAGGAGAAQAATATTLRLPAPGSGLRTRTHPTHTVTREEAGHMSTLRKRLRVTSVVAGIGIVAVLVAGCARGGDAGGSGDATEGPAEASPGITDTSITLRHHHPAHRRDRRPGHLHGRRRHSPTSARRTPRAASSSATARPARSRSRPTTTRTTRRRRSANFDQMVTDGVFAMPASGSARRPTARGAKRRSTTRFRRCSS